MTWTFAGWLILLLIMQNCKQKQPTFIFNLRIHLRAFSFFVGLWYLCFYRGRREDALSSRLQRTEKVHRSKSSPQDRQAQVGDLLKKFLFNLACIACWRVPMRYKGEDVFLFRAYTQCGPPKSRTLVLKQFCSKKISGPHCTFCF